MTRTPTHDNAPGMRPIPLIDAVDLDLLAKAARSGKRDHSRSIVAVDYTQSGDTRVFGAVFAIQHLEGEPWLVRGVLREGDEGPPILTRIAVEHFSDPNREVGGAIMRDIRFAEIRDRALVRLRERAWSLAHIKAAPPATVDAAHAAAKKAARKIAVGPHGAYPTDHYRYIAERYLALVASGRRDIHRALCEEESERLREPIGRERMRDWVRKATELGFLESGRRGFVGRLPGPNLRREGRSDG